MPRMICTNYDSDRIWLNETMCLPTSQSLISWTKHSPCILALHNLYFPPLFNVDSWILWVGTGHDFQMWWKNKVCTGQTRNCIQGLEFEESDPIVIPTMSWGLPLHQILQYYIVIIHGSHNITHLITQNKIITT